MPEAPAGGAAPAPAAPAPGAAAAPAAAAAASPPATPPAGGAEATPGGAAAAASSNVIVDAGKEPAAFNAEEAKAFLTEKGMKAEELAALDEGGLKAKFEEAKAAAAKPKADTADSIEVKVPEGFTIGEKQLGDFKSILADATTSASEKAQKLVEMHAAAVRALREEPVNYWRDMQAKWVDEINKDPEMGGAANLETRNKVFASALAFYDSKYGADAGKELRIALGMTGAGNNPHIARLIFARFKGDIESGSSEIGKPADAEGSFKKAVNAMYPTANPVS